MRDYSLAMRDSDDSCLILSADQPVRAVMSRLLRHIDIDATLDDVREQMSSHDVHHLLMFERERLVRVISDRDVLSHLSPNLGTLAERRDDPATLRRRVFHAASFLPTTVP
jgi:acetoin utilization protein AcuB